MIRFCSLPTPHLFLLPWDRVYIAARESNGPLWHIPSAVAQYGTSRCPKIGHIVEIWPVLRHSDHKKRNFLDSRACDRVYIAARESHGPLGYISSAVAQYGTSRCPRIENIWRKTVLYFKSSKMRTSESSTLLLRTQHDSKSALNSTLINYWICKELLLSLP